MKGIEGDEPFVQNWKLRKFRFLVAEITFTKLQMEFERFPQIRIPIRSERMCKSYRSRGCR
jgi:hypothetical protein